MVILLFPDASRHRGIVAAYPLPAPPVPQRAAGEHWHSSAPGYLGGSICRPAGLASTGASPGYSPGSFHRHWVDRDRIPAAYAGAQRVSTTETDE